MGAIDAFNYILHSSYLIIPIKLQIIHCNVHKLLAELLRKKVLHV
jgi:hypothetical protein